ncbi:MAG: hypothetical protein HKN68_11605 [Saprospiraceae bacterium]|nr:hypothetical protein [Saprospiraceae bacterium]
MKSTQYLVAAILFVANLSLNAQSISINNTGDTPDPSSMLDVQSTSKGMLIPRMSSTQRVNILNAANGLLVFDTTTSSFWFRQNGNWKELNDDTDIISDADNDTKIQVEESADEDIIRFDIGGNEGMSLKENINGGTLLDMGADLGLIIGHQAGENSIPGFNTILGYKAAEENTFGQRNVIIGYQAGQRQIDVDRGVIIGYDAGKNNDATGNTFIGYQSGITNTTGHSNLFLGYQSGFDNLDGYRNTFSGYSSGANNTTGYQNTFFGFNSGLHSTIGDNNVFLGVNAGLANRTGNGNTIVGMSAGGNQLNGVDIGNENTFVGFQSGYFINEGSENVLIGFQSGNNLSSGRANILIGKESGFAIDDDSLNVAIGLHSMRNNNQGSANISVGDSSLFLNDGNSNLAFGSNAGYDNTSGSGNVFIGHGSGINASTEMNNIFIGNNSGIGPTDNPSGSIALGNNVELKENNTIILGDENNMDIEVGIGTNVTNAKLHVEKSGGGGDIIFIAGTPAGRSITSYDNRGVAIGTDNAPPERGLLTQGKSFFRDTVTINRSAPADGYILSVNGDIACEEVRIQNAMAWPDYVFDEEYALLPLEELEQLVLSQRHLPGIPPAAEINENGILMNDITVGLLEKIEQLFLYVFDLKRENQILKEKIGWKDE